MWPPSRWGSVPAPEKDSEPFLGGFSGLSRLCGGQNRAPAEAQRSGFGGKRSRSGMIEFSPLSAETSDMELASTRSRIKGWRRNRRFTRSLLPAVRAVDGGFSAVGCGAFYGEFWNGWRLCSRKRRCSKDFGGALWPFLEKTEVITSLKTGSARRAYFAPL